MNGIHELPFGRKSIAKDIEALMAGAMYHIHKTNLPIGAIKIIAHDHLVDKYGNESVDAIYFTHLEEETIDKINWDQDDFSLQKEIIPANWIKKDIIGVDD